MKFNQYVLEINFFLFLFLVFTAFIAGVLLNRKKIVQLSDKIYEAERDLTNANIEIVDYIETHKKLSEELEKLKESKTFFRDSEDEKVKDIRLGKIG